MLEVGQKLTETWEITFEGRESRSPGGYRRFVTGTISKWFHGTIYGGNAGEGQTIDEARLAMVLGTARAICDDDTAFVHDADQLHLARTLAWFTGRMEELEEELEEEQQGELPRKSVCNKLKRQMKFLNQLTAEWQEEHDYYPQEEDAPGSQTTREADIRSARASLIRQARTVREAAESIAAGSSKD